MNWENIVKNSINPTAKKIIDKQTNPFERDDKELCYVAIDHKGHVQGVFKNKDKAVKFSKGAGEKGVDFTVEQHTYYSE